MWGEERSTALEALRSGEQQGLGKLSIYQLPAIQSPGPGEVSTPWGNPSRVSQTIMVRDLVLSGAGKIQTSDCGGKEFSIVSRS